MYAWEVNMKERHQVVSSCQVAMLKIVGMFEMKCHIPATASEWRDINNNDKNKYYYFTRTILLANLN